MCNKICKSLVTFVFLCGWSYTSFSKVVENQPEEKHILILHSYHQGLEWTDNITKGIESVFKSRSDINLVFEYLDTKRNYKSEYHEALLQLYSAKSHMVPFKAIIVSDNAAFNFMLENGDKYYSDVPVIYCGVNNLDTSIFSINSNFYGIEEKADHEGSIKAIRQIFPQRKNVLIVNDNTLTGQAIRKELDGVIRKFEGELNFEFISDFTLESLTSRVATLDDNYAIYLLVMNRDKNGNFISYRNGIKALKDVSSVPIFGSWDFYEGKGLFGGKIVRGFLQGEYVAKLAKHIVDAESVNKLPHYGHIESNYYFDYNELQQFQVKENRLPPNSIVFNSPESDSGIQKVLIISEIVLVGVIVFLIVAIRVRKKQKIKLQKLVDKRTEELSEINNELEDVIKKKDKFFSILAHDLRNHIGVFLSFSMLLNNDEFLTKTEKVKAIRVELLNSANYTNNLLEDLLYWGMNQFAKNTKAIKTQISLNKILKTITKAYKINSYDISFEFFLDKEAVIYSDPNIVKFILRNIVHNAMKYSNKGGLVELHTKVEASKVCVSVRDYGMGMTPEIVKSIYDGNPIQKMAENNSSSTGLGLETALEYLKTINGSLEIESKPGKGSLFKICFAKP